ncbi:dihydrodipicolinate synthase family protein [Agrobacterium sp. LAD9]|uniref:dihydrodipicolinate synthase family protein n=1 Tax=Agrobacterium sp. LAD9 TaxID=2055153 RepID=UPI000D1FBD8C|nr:dihydrodipicolinate synthase family protein [Agrobacterium sp. LAD9]
MSETSTKAWVVSLTHFDRDGRLDESAMRAHFLRLADGGQNVYAASTNIGEGFSLDEAELSRTLSIAVETLKGRAGVRAGGREARSAGEALTTIRLAQEAGVSAIHLFQLDVGHGSSKPDAGELERFYYQVLDNSDLPIVLSNYPKLGYPVPVELVEKLAERFPQIIGVRDASGDMAYLAKLVSQFKGRLEISAVGVRAMLPALFQGADTIMTTEANIAPALVSAVIDAFCAGDLETLHRSYCGLVSLHLALNRFGGSGGRGMKSLLDGLGLPGGMLRPPRKPISRDDQQMLLKLVRQLDLPELKGVCTS